MRGVMRLALLLPFAALVPVTAASAQQPAFEEGIVEIVAERLAPLTVLVLVDPAGSMLLPLGDVVRHLGFAIEPRDNVVSLPRPGGAMAVLDRRAGILVIAGDTSSLAPAELVITTDATYLRAERLAAMLDAELTLNPATLTIALTRRVPFPAQQRLIAEQRRAMLLAQQRQSENVLDRAVPYGIESGIGVVDWELATRAFDPGALTSARLFSGAALLGGDLTAGVTLEAGRDALGHARDATLRYRRVFPHGRHVTQVNAGGIMSSGFFGRFIRGVEISNRPFMHRDVLGEVLVRPDLPAGWDYEVFQGNQLLGYSETGSREPVAIPLRTGTTPVQIRMLGPSGEEVVTTLLYQTPVSMLGHGRLEYAVAAGGCDGGPCEQYAHADARYGATSHLTVGGGVELLTDSAGSYTRPYAIASVTSGYRWTGEFQLMPGALYGSSLAFYPREGSTARLRSSLSRPGFGPISLIPDELARWDVDLAWDERLTAGTSSLAGRTLPFSSVRGGVAAAGSATRGLERWRAAAAGSFNRGYAEIRYDYENAARRPHLLSARSALLLPVTFRGSLYRPMLNSTVGVGGVGLRLVEVGASVQPRGSSVLNAGVMWARGAAQPSFTLGWTARLGSVQSTLRGVVGRGGASSAAIVSGSTTITHAGDISTRATARTGYAGLHGVVFVDHDGDGVFSPGDETVPGVAIVAGGIPITADERGRYHVWGLQPYAVAAISVDSTRVPDPSWTTATPAILVRPTPNTAARADIALVQTRELFGTIIAGTGVATSGGVTLHITNLDTDAVASALTFSDGQFYISRVRPGRYRLTVAESSLAALGAAANPAFIDFDVRAGVGDLVLELPPIHLAPTN